jgi:hypothetical protein
VAILLSTEYCQKEKAIQKYYTEPSYQSPIRLRKTYLDMQELKKHITQENLWIKRRERRL